VKGRKKTGGFPRDTGRRGRDWSYEGDRGLGQVPARAQKPLTYGAGGAVDRKVQHHKKLRRRG